jgi:hypothetical protein
MKTSYKHILVTGPHRSGTTWIGKTLSQNNRVELVYEPFNPDFDRYNFTYRFENWFQYVPGSKNRKVIETYFDQYLPESGLDYAKKVSRESGYSAKTPLIFLKHLLMSANRPRFLLKDPIALLSAGWLYDRYSPKVICTTRNPLAFVGSLKKQGWDFDFRNILNQETLVERYLPQYKKPMQEVLHEGDFIDRVSLLWSVLNTMILHYREQYPQWFFTSHEEAALNPVDTFQNMFAYVNLPFTDEIISYIEKATSGDDHGKKSSHRYTPRDAKSTINEWNELLTADEINRISEYTSAVCLNIYGCEPTRAGLAE